MFVENTKNMLYLFFMVPILMVVSLFCGVAIRDIGWVGVSGFLVLVASLIVGLLVYSKLPNIEIGNLFTFGIQNISAIVGGHIKYRFIYLLFSISFLLF